MDVNRTECMRSPRKIDGFIKDMKAVGLLQEVCDGCERTVTRGCACHVGTHWKLMTSYLSPEVASKYRKLQLAEKLPSQTRA